MNSSSLVCLEVFLLPLFFICLFQTLWTDLQGETFSWCGVLECAVILGLVLLGSKCESAWWLWSREA